MDGKLTKGEHSLPKRSDNDGQGNAPLNVSSATSSGGNMVTGTSPRPTSFSGSSSQPPRASLVINETPKEDEISDVKARNGQDSAFWKTEAKSQIASWSCDDSEGGVRTPDPKRTFSPKLKLSSLNVTMKESVAKIQHLTALWYKQYIIQWILRQRDIVPTKDGRHVDLDISRDKPLIDEKTGRPYIDNSIRSSRYTIWNFIPCQLWFQFSKAANCFFLIIGILQLVPGLSTTGSFTTILPLLFFLVFIIIREGYDDFRRYQLDKVDNRKLARVLNTSRSNGVSIVPTALLSSSKEYWQRMTRGAKTSAVTSVTASSEESIGDANPSEIFQSDNISASSIKWKDLRVGDVIELTRNDALPADIVLLHADGRDGIAYIETMSLDGETNLKIRRAPNHLSCRSAAEISKCRAQFAVEDPNPNLYEFYGKVTVNGKTSPVTPDNVAYRGSTLRNTNLVLGMVINTGEECKLRMNANKSPKPKAPAIQHETNKVVVLLVLFVVLLATGCTAGYEIWMTPFEGKAWYLNNAHLGPAEIFIAFAIEFNNLIPLALYVSLELVKFAQFFLLHDIEMYDEASNTPMVSNTQNIYEDLGQISYILSDKTGTLTENVMRFQKVSVAGTALVHSVGPEASIEEKRPQPVRSSFSHQYGGPETPTIVETDAGDITRPSGEAFPFPAIRRSLNMPRLEYPTPQHWDREMSTKNFLENLWSNPNPSVAKKVRFFLLSLALCHTCFPEAREDGQPGFQAASPDELALVEAAVELGYVMTDRTTRSITLSIKGSELEPPVQEVYEVLDVIEFSSKRKRMSIVIKFPDGRVCLFCKGADSVIQPLLNLSSLAMQKGAEVRQRQEQRKSFEVDEAILRKSHDELSRKSLQRSSFQMERPSMELRRIISGRRSLAIEETVTGSRPAVQRNNTYGGGSSGLRVSSQIDNRFLALPPSEPSTPRVSSDFQPLDDAHIFERCLEHIDGFASEGLRTLMFGYRFVTGDEYSTWSKLFHDATTSLVNRQEMIESAAEIIEKNLDLAGATGIEDKLQDGVPETIEKLQKANIKIWMLTGDKRETAINIAQSARLCRTYSRIFILDHKQGSLPQQIDAASLSIAEGRIAHSVVVIDGQTLVEVESDSLTALNFYNLLLRSDSVICCRASPAQKASMVKNIRQKVPGSMTLAIGDGGNDIAMIQEAHVGVGISGKEGLQAARVADYSIAQFRFLQRLLLVHGHWNYNRIARYALATFWKEMLFYCIQLLYQKWNGYTGTSLYENWSLTVWNTLFTSLCVMIPGVFEQDLSAETLLAVPEIYSYGQNSQGFNLRICGWWMLKASVEAVVVYFMIYGIYGVVLFTEDQGLFAIGDLAFTVCVVYINAKLLILDSHYKTWIPLTAAAITILGWGVWNVFLSVAYANNPGSYGVYGSFVHHFGKNPAWWATLVVVLGVLFVCEILIAVLKRRFWPNVVDVWQEVERDRRLGKYGDEGGAGID